MTTQPQSPARARPLEGVKAETIRRAGKLNPLDGINPEDGVTVANALTSIDRDGAPDQFRQQRVEFLDSLFLGFKVAVLAAGIRFFNVQEEKVEVVPHLLQCRHLVPERLAPLQHGHADQPGQPLVHRIDRDGGGQIGDDLVEAALRGRDSGRYTNGVSTTVAG